MQQLLYQQRAYPVFQNRMYGSADDARNCPKGDILLTQDPRNRGHREQSSISAGTS